ncbi:hypothetical protein P692DRAFT_20880320 [Suillus brevipes Sb2]|nr:hypothetical protein P692DRAFT_20880320 [Suillus brevipes Sb2]
MDGHEPSRRLELTSQLKHSINFPAISIKKLVPSSACSPPSLQPTQHTASLEKVKDVINRVLPVNKKRNALKEVLQEDYSEANALGGELFI